MEKQGNRLYYGWAIVAASAVNMVFIYGARYSFSVFFVAILDEFNWSRASTAAMFSLNLLMYGLVAPPAGILVDRFGSRKMIPIGAVLIAVGIAAASRFDQLWQFYAAYGVLVGAGLCFGGFPVHVPMLSNWFVRHRGTAMGLALAGIGGSFLMAPLAQALISAYGWRTAYQLLAVMVIVVVFPITFLVLRARPARAQEPKAQQPAGPRADSPSHRVVSKPDPKLSDVVKGRYFWLLSIAMFFSTGLGWSLLVVHQVALAKDIGFSAGFAASVFGLIGVSNALGYLAASLSDKIGKEISYLIGCMFAVIALIVMMQIRDTSQSWMLYPYAVLFGFSCGVTTPVATALSSELFHGKHFGLISSLINSVSFALGGALAPWLGGMIRDNTGSYSTAVMIAIGSWILAAVCVGLVGLFRNTTPALARAE